MLPKIMVSGEIVLEVDWHTVDSVELLKCYSHGADDTETER